MALDLFDEAFPLGARFVRGGAVPTREVRGHVLAEAARAVMKATSLGFATGAAEDHRVPRAPDAARAITSSSFHGARVDSPESRSMTSRSLSTRTIILRPTRANGIPFAITNARKARGVGKPV
jgi:hypothetical protein